MEVVFVFLDITSRAVSVNSVLYSPISQITSDSWASSQADHKIRHGEDFIQQDAHDGKRDQA